MEKKDETTQAEQFHFEIPEDTPHIYSEFTAVNSSELDVHINFFEVIPPLDLPNQSKRIVRVRNKVRIVLPKRAANTLLQSLKLQLERPPKDEASKDKGIVQ